MSGFTKRSRWPVSNEPDLPKVTEALRNRSLIFASAALRSSAISFSGVILALYLASARFSVVGIGWVVALGLAGASAATLFVVLGPPIRDEKKALVGFAFLMALGGLVFAFSTNFFMLIPFAFFDMVNGMGRDRGASATIEQAILPTTATEKERTRVFAWYNVCVDAGHATGALLAALPAVFRARFHMETVRSYQGAWLVYAALLAAAGFVALRLSPSARSAEHPPISRLSPESRPMVRNFALLSGLDSLGGGFLTTALISFWFFKRFGVDESFLGPLFFFARLANVFSHLAAAWVAKKIGLIKTMVFTHIPSSLLLMTIPFMPSIGVAVALFLVRESLVEMDVPTRQSYIAAVVKPEERVKAAGLANLTRGVAWAAGPAIGGTLSVISMSLPILIGPGIKIVYDILLYRQFHKIKPPEEIVLVSVGQK